MLKFVPKLCEIHEKILEGVKNNKFEDKRIFCKENKSKLQFLIKENYLTYDTSVYPQKLALTEKASIYLSTGVTPSKIEIRKNHG